jgi:hypothetical protein
MSMIKCCISIRSCLAMTYTADIAKVQSIISNQSELRPKC